MAKDTGGKNKDMSWNPLKGFLLGKKKTLIDIESSVSMVNASCSPLEPPQTGTIHIDHWNALKQQLDK